MNRTALCLAALLAACAVDSDRFGRDFVSPRLQAHTDQRLGPERAPGVASLPDNVELADGINAQEATAIALWNNPTFLEALAELGVTRAALMQAGLLANPQFVLLLPVGVRGAQTTLTGPLESLWLRSRRMQVAELECERVGESLVQGGLNLVRDVQLAWASLIDAQQRAALTRRTVELRQSLNEFYQVRLRAGSASQLECSDARIQLLTAEQRSLQATQDIQLAEGRLRAVMGAGAITSNVQFVPLCSEPTEFVIQAALLVEQALINRPDLRAAELLVEQEATRAGLAKLEALRIAGLLRSNNDTAAIGGAGINFAPGIQFDIPIFDWGQGQSAAVTARLDRAARRCWTIREQISLQVHEACLQAAYARQNLRQWRNHLEPAIRHSMDVAQRAFERGNMNKLTVLQQGLALVDAQDQTRQAATALRNATTQLEWSVARNLATETAK